MIRFFALFTLLWHSIHSFTGPYIVRDLQYVKDRCQRYYSCAGVYYQSSGHKYKVFVKAYFSAHDHVPSGFSTWKASKEYLYFNARVSGQVSTSEYTTILDAERVCKASKACIGFHIREHEDARAFEMEVKKRTNENVYVERVNPPSMLFKIEYLKAVDSATMTKDTLDYLTSLKTNEDAIKISATMNDGMLDPTGYCCHDHGDLPTILELKQLDSIERISCDISKDEFQTRYEETRTPVVLIGCDTNWKAKDLWQPGKFEKLYFRNDTVVRAFKYSTDPELYFDFKEKPYLWQTLYESKMKRKESQDRHNRFYISQRIKDTELFYHDFSTPPMFPSPQHSIMNYVKKFKSDFYPYNFLYFGEKDSSSPLHTDFVETDAWNCLLHGQKWWILLPPDDHRKPYDFRCDQQCSSSVKGNAWFSSVGQYIHNLKFSKPALHFLQSPGETLYLPHDYMHTTLSFGDTIGVSAGFVSNSNFLAFWNLVKSKATFTEQHRLYNSHLTKYQRKLARQNGLYSHSL